MFYKRLLAYPIIGIILFMAFVWIIGGIPTIWWQKILILAVPFGITLGLYSLFELDRFN